MSLSREKSIIEFEGVPYQVSGYESDSNGRHWVFLAPCSSVEGTWKTMEGEPLRDIPLDDFEPNFKCLDEYSKTRYSRDYFPALRDPDA